MQRRQFIAGIAAGAPLGLAGCLGAPSTSDDAAATDTTTDAGTLSVGDAADLADGGSLSVADVGAAAFVATRGEGDDQVHSEADGRYVTVKFAPDGIDDYRSFVSEHVTLTLNGDHEFGDPLFPIGGGPSRFDAAFAVPSDVTPYGATVELDAEETTATWELDARDIEAITQSVDYEVTGLTAPDSVAPGASFTAELEVVNDGDAVTFRGVVEGTAGAPSRFARDVAAGATETLTFDVTAPPADGETFDVAIDYGHADAAATVAYE
ncbi:hypothetical protein ABSL23_07855 [Halobacterium sp. NMX12-1]|uniref:DUF4352 domain-containing protein n=1 Tax=Halobacterium sp. NMX12-1 TaxID=3166650 RepID=A0AAU8CGM8_9EURY